MNDAKSLRDNTKGLTSHAEVKDETEKLLHGMRCDRCIHDAGVREIHRRLPRAHEFERRRHDRREQSPYSCGDGEL